MKINLMMSFALAGLFAMAPVCAAEKAAAKDADKAVDGAAAEAPAKPKKKIAKKPMYTKFDEAMKVAAANEEPVLVLMMPDGNANAQFLEKELFKKPQFAKDYAKANLILLKFKLKKDKSGLMVDTKSFKENERRFVENWGLDERKVALAKKDNKTLSPFEMTNYPAIICVKGDAENQELLFRMDAYDRDGGFGVWLSSLDALLRTKEIEPKVSAAVQKILDDPTGFAGKKKGK